MMKNYNLINLLCIGVMISCVLLSFQYYFYMTNNECVLNPLVYATNYYEDLYGEKFMGSLSMIRNGGNPFIISFNSENISIQYDLDNKRSLMPINLSIPLS